MRLEKNYVGYKCFDVRTRFKFAYKKYKRKIKRLNVSHTNRQKDALSFKVYLASSSFAIENFN